MKINESTLLEGHKAVLVPYNADHVARYHEWMQSPELLKLTASEPLTLEQEYNLQKSWREDDDKCTFIILDKQRWADPSIEEEKCMVGDVNIFLTDPTDPSVAELEIMIAEPSYRGKGMGKEVIRMMMCYDELYGALKINRSNTQRDKPAPVKIQIVETGNVTFAVTKLGIKKFQAKIGLDNHVSITMFKKIHFQEVSVCQVFKEVTLEMTVDESVRKKLQDDMVDMKERDYTQTCNNRQKMDS